MVLPKNKCHFCFCFVFCVCYFFGHNSKLLYVYDNLQKKKLFQLPNIQWKCWPLEIYANSLMDKKLRNANVFSVITVFVFLFVLLYLALVSNRSTQFCAVHSLSQFCLVRLYALKINITINVSLPKKETSNRIFLGLQNSSNCRIKNTHSYNDIHTKNDR